jgi:cell division protein FtsZ
VIDESMGDEVRITVIATGFGEPAVKQSAPRPSVAAAEPRDTRPVRAMGRVIDDELDVPTWQRRNQDAPVAQAAAAPAARRGPVGDSVRDEEYDIPTFLRRGAE